MAQEQKFPFVRASAYSQEADDGFNIASGDGIIRPSEILRSAGDMWLRNHRWLMQQGYSALDATRYLIEQTKKSAQPPPQPQPQPSFVPQPAPMSSPFQAPMNGGPRANP